MDHIYYHRLNWRACPDIWSEEHRTKHGQRTMKNTNTHPYIPCNNSPLDKNPTAEPEIEPKTYWSVIHNVTTRPVGLVGLGVTCSPRDTRFADSNPAEVHGFFQDVKILSTSPPGRTLSWGSRV